MKTLILTLSLLLCAVGISYAQGQKEPTYPPYCWVQPGGDENELWYPCGTNEVKVLHCNKLMDIAMHGVDPYLQFLESGLPTFTPEEKDKYTRALYAWNRIKHECWKEYEEERLDGMHIH